MIELFKEKQDCCGCTACAVVCPTGAITMEADEEGFLYPQINIDKCNECGLCKRVCAFQNGYNTADNFEIPYVYAVKHKDEKVRMSSSSGGAFTAVSDYVLRINGVVYGATYDNEFNVVHQRAEKNEERDKFKGSKYIQSDLKNVYRNVKEDLANNRNVLFTGTPCQVAGLKSFLKNFDISKLLLCDVICYAVPSPLMWKEYIAFLKAKNGLQIKEFDFKSKEDGWHKPVVSIKYTNGKTDCESALSQAHRTLYNTNNISRPSCHNCKYTNLIRPSDITIGDFWGIEKCMPEFDDNKGISLVLINTKKGAECFNGVKGDVAFKVSNTKDCLQSKLQYPSKPSPKRDEFWNDYNKNGYKHLLEKYAACNFKDRLKKYVRKALKKMGI